VAIRQCFYTARGGTGLEQNLMLSPFISMLGLTLVLSGIFLVCMLPAFALAGIIILWYRWLSFILPLCPIAGLPFLCYPFTRLWLAPFFLVDRSEEVFASIEDAWHTSSGNFWKLFASLIVFLMIAYFPVFVCWIISEFVLEWDMDSIQGTLIVSAGLVPTIAITWIGGVLAYLQLTGQTNCLDGVRS
jgi:hypothetical protein